MLLLHFPELSSEKTVKIITTQADSNNDAGIECAGIVTANMQAVIRGVLKHTLLHSASKSGSADLSSSSFLASQI